MYKFIVLKDVDVTLIVLSLVAYGTSGISLIAVTV